MMKKLTLGILTFVLLFACSNEQPKLYMAGDSTMADKKEKHKPETGWGEALPDYFQDDFYTENHAQNGRSTRSFIYEGRWDSLIAKVNTGDYVIIQFGHNDDVVTKIGKHSTLEEYAYNLNRYVNDVKAKGANPILCTPIQRRKFDSTGVLKNTHGEYPATAIQVAADNNVPMVDMQALSDSLINAMGDNASTSLFMHLKPDEYPNYPKGRTDDTHFKTEGAHVMAELFVAEIKKQNLPLAQYLK